MATFLYNPDRKSKTELIAEFVVRTDIYEEIMHDLETSKMDHPEQHYLLVGQRGSGKTTLLNRIKYGIEDSKVLKDKVIPIIFSEEQYNISELVNLWESVAQNLEDYHGFEHLYDEVEGNQARENFEELSYEVLERHLKANKRKLVLLVDNIGDMLKKMDKTEVHRLREILQTKSEIRLIAGSPFYLETVLDYQQPLFEFFKVLRLDGLSQKETQDLLLKLGEVNGAKEKIEKIIKETPERIETLRTLTGGVPRTIALMFNIFIEYNNEDTVKDLEKILDAVTPLYKHRMDDLPTQQQKIVDAVAKNWDGISVKELKEKLRIESKTISAQLRQLEKDQIIQTIETTTKNNIYFLKERFFNIWYLMRYGRKYDKQRVVWLVKFLESWCSTNEIEQRIVDYIKRLQEGKATDQFINFYGQVYVAMENLRPEIKMILKESAPQYLTGEIKIEDNEIVRIAGENVKIKQFKKAFDVLKQLTNPDKQSLLTILEYFAELITHDRKYYFDLTQEVIKKVAHEKPVNISFYEFTVFLFFINFTCTHNLINKDYAGAHKYLDILVNVAIAPPENKDFEMLKIAISSQVFISFLAFDQYNSINNIFEKYPFLKEKAKPIYYTTQKLLGNNSEILKMGSELNEVVDQIVQIIRNSQIGGTSLSSNLADS